MQSSPVQVSSGAAPVDEPLAKRGQRRRHDEHGQRLGQHCFDLPHSLRLRLDDYDPMVPESVRERVLADSLEVAVHHRPFEEVPSLDLRAELLGLVEVVVDPALFPATWLAARRGDVHHSVFQFFHEPVDHRVLPAAGRRGDDHEQTATVDAQRSSSSSGVAVTGVPSPARYATRSGASGAVKVRSPPRGRRTVRRHA